MRTQAGLAQQFNKNLQRIYALSAELQILLCILFWILIAFAIAQFNVQKGLNITLLVWVPLFLLLNGLISGPFVAILGAALCTFVLSPIGFFDKVSLHIEQLAPISIVFFLVAGIGGGLKRLLMELNERLENSLLQVQGTELPNKKAAVKHLETILESKEESAQELDILSVQLENLAQIRALQGQEHTDQLVKDFAGILKTKLGSGSYISQTATNELLGILVANKDKPLEVKSILRSAVKEVSAKHKDKGPAIASTASVERRALKGTAHNASEWLEKALVSADDKKAKVAQALATKTKLEQASNTAAPKKEDVFVIGKTPACLIIQTALANGEIVIDYLPRLNVDNGYFSALEAVISWHHPKRGELGLDEILVTLDEPMAVPRLNRWLVGQVFRDVDSWIEQGHRFVVTVKGALDGHISAPLIEKALLWIKQHPANTGWLSLEFAEVSLSKAGPKAIESLRYLQQYGGTVIVSSYHGTTLPPNEIFQLPVDAIKLSPHFLKSASTSSDKRRELGSLIKLIHSRGLTVIADGIDNSAVIRMLRPYGCDELIGPFLSRPIARKNIPWGRIRT